MEQSNRGGIKIMERSQQGLNKVASSDCKEMKVRCEVEAKSRIDHLSQ